MLEKKHCKRPSQPHRDSEILSHRQYRTKGWHHAQFLPEHSTIHYEGKLTFQTLVVIAATIERGCRHAKSRQTEQFEVAIEIDVREQTSVRLLTKTTHIGRTSPGQAARLHQVPHFDHEILINQPFGQEIRRRVYHQHTILSHLSHLVRLSR